jgi:hypothetical protein
VVISQIGFPGKISSCEDPRKAIIAILRVFYFGGVLASAIGKADSL